MKKFLRTSFRGLLMALCLSQVPVVATNPKEAVVKYAMITRNFVKTNEIFFFFVAFAGSAVALEMAHRSFLSWRQHRLEIEGAKKRYRASALRFIKNDPDRFNEY